MVKKLFVQEKDSLQKVLNIPSVKNETILVFAARNIQDDSLEIMKFLVENGADPEAKTADDKPISFFLNESLKKQWNVFLQDYTSGKELALEREKATQKSSLNQSALFFKSFFANSTDSDEQAAPLLLETKFKKD